MIVPKNNVKKKEALLTFLALAFVTFWVFRYFLVFKYAYYFFDIFGDGFYSFYPSLCCYADNILRYTIPSWSFDVGMGQNIFPFLLRDPFDVILYLVGSKYILQATVYIEVIKIISSGMLFYSYLRIMNMSFITGIIGALLFAYCGFDTIGGTWFIFSFEVFNFILFLYAFEVYIRNGRWQLLPIPIMLYSISIPFNLYLYGTFFFVYILWRLISEEKISLSRIGALSKTLIGTAMLGLLLAGPVLLQSILMLVNSPRGNPETTYRNQYRDVKMWQIADDLQLGSAIQRLFSNDILGSGSYFKGWDTILGSPLFYCGIISLVLLPQYFCYGSKKNRILSFVFLLLWTLPVIFPFFRRALWLFSGDYYRGYSFMVCFLILFFAMNALERIVVQRLVNRVVLIVTGVVLVALLFLHPFLNEKIIDKEVQAMVAIFLLIYFCLFMGVQWFKKEKAFHILLFIFVIVETYLLGFISINRRDAFQMNWLVKERTMYRDYHLDAVDYLKQNDKTFFRIDKNFDPPSARFTDLNVSQYQGYHGTTSYNSFNSLYYVRYLQTMGVINPDDEQESRWAIGTIDKPVLQTENYVKYFLSVKGYKPPGSGMWDSIGVFHNVTVFKNKWVLPFGYTFNNFISSETFKKLPAGLKSYAIINTCIVDSKNLHYLTGIPECNLDVADTLRYTKDSSLLWSDLQQHKQDTLEITHFSDVCVEGRVNANQSEIMYLSIPFDEGWHIFMDEKEEKSFVINGGMTGIVVKPGGHAIKMVYELKYAKPGVAMTVMGVLLMLIFSFPVFGKKRSRETS